MYERIKENKPDVSQRNQSPADVTMSLCVLKEQLLPSVFGQEWFSSFPLLSFLIYGLLEAVPQTSLTHGKPLYSHF